MDKTILKHILIRIGFIIGISILLSSLMLSGTGANSDAAGNAMARGLTAIFAMGISLIIIIVGLLVDVFVLYYKKEKNKLKASITLLILTILVSLVGFLIMP